MSKQFINEVSRMKNLFDYKRGVVISEQADKNSIENKRQELARKKAKEETKLGAFTITEQVKGSTKEEYPECVKGFGNPVASSSGKEYSIIGAGDWADYYFYPNNFYGSFKITNTKPPHGKYSCNGKTIKIEPLDSEKTVQSPEATQWTKEPATLDDDKNTLRKQMTGEKVKQLQTGLDIKGRGGKSLATGKFWTLTDAKLKELYPSEYTTQKGVTKTLFDKIVNPTLKASTAPAPTTIPAAGATPAGTTPAAPAAGTPPATVTAPAAGAAPAPALKPIVAPTVAPTRPEAYFETLKKAGFIEGEGQNTVRFRAPRGQKTPNLMKDQQDLLTQQMNNMGYDFYRKGKDNRLVYTKR